MLAPKQTTIPTLVRVKPGALDRLGIYAERHEFWRIALFFSEDLDERLIGRLTASLRARKIEVLQQTPVGSLGFEKVTDLFRECPRNADAIIGFGGGKALDVGKYIAFLWRLPYFSVPTSLSNDGFCSPQSSLTIGGRRQLATCGNAIRRHSRYRGVFECSGYPLALRGRRSGFEIHSGSRLENSLS